MTPRLKVRSVVRNSRIVSGGPEGCGRLKIDLSQLIISVSHGFQQSEHAVSFYLANVRANPTCEAGHPASPARVLSEGLGFTARHLRRSAP